jgi:hypothetical protein
MVPCSALWAPPWIPPPWFIGREKADALKDSGKKDRYRRIPDSSEAEREGPENNKEEER